MKRKSAFNKALQEAQNSTTVEQQNGETVQPSNSDTVKPLDGEGVPQQNSTTVKPLNSETVKSGLMKTSFYIRSDQAEKLDDLAHEYKKRAGKRIDRQDIVRALIDSADLENLLSLMG